MQCFHIVFIAFYFVSLSQTWLRASPDPGPRVSARAGEPGLHAAGARQADAGLEAVLHRHTDESQ